MWDYNTTGCLTFPNTFSLFPTFTLKDEFFIAELQLRKTVTWPLTSLWTLSVGTDWVTNHIKKGKEWKKSVLLFSVCVAKRVSSIHLSASLKEYTSYVKIADLPSTTPLLWTAPVWGTVVQSNSWPCSSSWSCRQLYTERIRTGWLPATRRPWSR